MTRACDVCGKVIGEGARPNEKRCSTSCSRAYLIIKRRGREYYEQRIKRKCAICGKRMDEAAHIRREFCSQSCKNENERLNYRDRGGSKYLKARGSVADRDGWKCYICGEDIPRDARRPDPLALEIDHLVPIRPREGEVKGGDEVVNLAAAHQVCNQRKGNKLTERAVEKLRKNIESYERSKVKEVYLLLADFGPYSFL